LSGKFEYDPSCCSYFNAGARHIFSFKESSTNGSINNVSTSGLSSTFLFKQFKMNAFASTDKFFSGNVGNAVLDAILNIACTCVEHSHQGGFAEAISITGEELVRGCKGVHFELFEEERGRETGRGDVIDGPVCGRFLEREDVSSAGVEVRAARRIVLKLSRQSVLGLLASVVG
jgi:hypothetical protein